MRSKMIFIAFMLPLLCVSAIQTANAQRSLGRAFARAVSGGATRSVGKSVVTRPSYGRILRPGTLSSIPTRRAGAVVGKTIPKPASRVVANKVNATAAKRVPKNNAAGPGKRLEKDPDFVKKSVAKKRLLASESEKAAKNRGAKFSRSKFSKKTGSEHRKNRNKLEKHQKGRRRQDMDKNKKERGDKRRPYQR